MITYSKTFWGIHLLFRFYGSTILRCCPFPLLSALMTAILFLYWKGKEDAFGHPYIFSAFAFIVSVAIVFRTNQGYQRYWEGRTLLQGMTGRWADAFMQASAFYSGDADNPEDRREEYQETLLHLFSLLHAVALQHLRGDWDLNNLHAMQSTDSPPPVDAAANKYMFSKPLRPGHHARYSLADFFVLSGTEERRNDYSRIMPIGVIGGVSSSESQSLGISLQRLEEPVFETAVFGSHSCNFSSMFHILFGLSTGTYVPLAAERVQIVYSWILQVLRQRIAEDKYGNPPTLAVNLFHMLSQGLIEFENARKLSDTPFPFPWAQVILALLVVFALSFPLLVVSYSKTMWLALVVDIIGVQSFFALNEVARDLEDPFVFEPNDIPLAYMQYQFNRRLQAGNSPVRPQYYSKGAVCMTPKTARASSPAAFQRHDVPEISPGQNGSAISGQTQGVLRRHLS